MLRNALTVAVLALWSCAAADVPEQGAAGGVGGGRCAAALHRGLVGQRIEDIDTAALPKALRIYAVDSIAMDHRPDRMNIVIGTGRRVVIVKCG